MRFTLSTAAVALLAVALNVQAAPVMLYKGGGNSKGPITGTLPRVSDAYGTKAGPGEPTRIQDPNQNIPKQQGASPACGISCGGKDQADAMSGKTYGVDTASKGFTDSGITAKPDPTKGDPSHHLLQSPSDMTAQQYQNKMADLPWQKFRRSESAGMIFVEQR